MDSYDNIYLGRRLSYASAYWNILMLSTTSSTVSVVADIRSGSTGTPHHLLFGSSENQIWATGYSYASGFVVSLMFIQVDASTSTF